MAGIIHSIEQALYRYDEGVDELAASLSNKELAHVSDVDRMFLVPAALLSLAGCNSSWTKEDMDRYNKGVAPSWVYNPPNPKLLGDSGCYPKLEAPSDGTLQTDARGNKIDRSLMETEKRATIEAFDPVRRAMCGTASLIIEATFDSFKEMCQMSSGEIGLRVYVKVKPGTMKCKKMFRFEHDPLKKKKKKH